MKYRIGLIMLLVFIISGCSSGFVRKMPSLDGISNVGEIYVFAPNGLLARTTITIDHESLLKFQWSEYAKFKVSPGEHYIGAKAYEDSDDLYGDTEIKFVVNPKEIKF